MEQVPSKVVIASLFNKLALGIRINLVKFDKILYFYINI